MFGRTYGIFECKNFSKIKKFKNLYDGQTCFIVGTGPSLTVEDLEKIKSYPSFSMNSIVLSFAQTTWRPTFYAIQDNYATKMLIGKCDYYNLLKNCIVLRGISTQKQTPNMQVKTIDFPLYVFNHDIEVNQHYTRFSPDVYKLVYDGYTITYSIMQIACYMGFKKIVLLGVDCNYAGPKKHFINYTDANNGNAAYLMRESYKIAKEYCDKHDIKILNATRNAKLDIFERSDLDAFLK